MLDTYHSLLKERPWAEHLSRDYSTHTSHGFIYRSVTSSQDKHNYEKIGESTEVALKVLAEKLNVYGLDRDGMTKQEKACTSYKAAQDEFEKVRVNGTACMQGINVAVCLGGRAVCVCVHSMAVFGGG